VYPFGSPLAIGLGRLAIVAHWPRCCDGGRLPALQFAFRSVRAHCIHEVRTMITRVAIPLLLLPLLVLTLPLMFA
jgi:hypothetical protein